MVVDHPHRLHERIADGRADEAEVATLELAAHRIALRRGDGNVAEAARAVADDRDRRELPQEARRKIKLRPNLLR